MWSERKIREADRLRRKKSGHRGRRQDGKVRLGEWELGVLLCNEYSTVAQTGTGKAQAGWVAIAGKGDASRRLGEEKWLQSDARRREDGKFGTEGGARSELRVE